MQEQRKYILAINNIRVKELANLCKILYNKKDKDHD